CHTVSSWSAPRFLFAFHWLSRGPAVSAAVSATPGSRETIAATIAPSINSPSWCASTTGSFDPSSPASFSIWPSTIFLCFIASMPVALMPFLQNRCVAALSRRPRADSSSPAPACGEWEFFFDDLFKEDLFWEDLAMSANLISAAPHQQAATVLRRKDSQAKA